MALSSKRLREDVGSDMPVRTTAPTASLGAWTARGFMVSETGRRSARTLKIDATPCDAWKGLAQFARDCGATPDTQWAGLDVAIAGSITRMRALGREIERLARGMGDQVNVERACDGWTAHRRSSVRRQCCLKGERAAGSGCAIQSSARLDSPRECNPSQRLTPALQHALAPRIGRQSPSTQRALLPQTNASPQALRAPGR